MDDFDVTDFGDLGRVFWYSKRRDFEDFKETFRTTIRRISIGSMSRPYQKDHGSAPRICDSFFAHLRQGLNPYEAIGRMLNKNN